MSVDRKYKIRIENTENFRARPRSNPEKGEPASLPTTSDNASTRHDTLLSPPNGERNEVRGVDESQAAGIGEAIPPNLNSTSSPLPSPPLQGEDGDGLARASALASEEHRTSNQNGETSSQPEAQDTGAVQHDGILSPPNGERNEVRGFNGSQQAGSRATAPPDLNSTSSPRPSPPLHGGEGDGFARASALASGEPRTQNPGSAAVPAASLEPRQRDGPGGRQGAPREHNHVTRQELKRELDSLRRLMETRK